MIVYRRNERLSCRRDADRTRDGRDAETGRPSQLAPFALRIPHTGRDSGVRTLLARYPLPYTEFTIWRHTKAVLYIFVTIVTHLVTQRYSCIPVLRCNSVKRTATGVRRVPGVASRRERRVTRRFRHVLEHIVGVDHGLDCIKMLEIVDCVGLGWNYARAQTTAAMPQPYDQAPLCTAVYIRSRHSMTHTLCLRPPLPASELSHALLACRRRSVRRPLPRLGPGILLSSAVNTMCTHTNTTSAV